MLRSVRATRDERGRSLPGDDMVTDPVGSLTHAITIGRPPGAVWPWLVQMGADRAGWYSYDRLDNGGRRSAERIVPALQHIEPGTLMPWLPGATEGFTVLRVEPEHDLVIGWISEPGAPPRMTWAFVLEEPTPGRSRLIVRARGAAGYRLFGLPRQLSMALAPAVHLLMQRKQLLGIARRAEAAPRPSTDEGT
jgi:uncharacterized protein YndB with AHSA1/START domain